ncbi:MAG: hypothetical protein J7K62_02450 [Thermoplasmata archaeon]|nr:hypothetical protein [Thermoplasmata archaeon]
MNENDREEVAVFPGILAELPREKRPVCPFYSVCKSPSKSLDWACGEGDMEQRCVTYYVLKNRLEKEEKGRLK